MLTKAFTLLLLGAVITRLFLHAQWKGLTTWLKRCVDLALFVFVVTWGVQLVVMAVR
jgi:hypothetical protein